MTDNEIAKVDIIEVLNNTDGMEHVSILCFDRNDGNETVIKVTDIIETLNRQKAEIERLQTENIILSQKRMNIFERLEFIEKAKSEAIKEFAESLKKRVTKGIGDCDIVEMFCEIIDSVLNQLEEMEGK